MNLNLNKEALLSVALLLLATTVVAQDTWTIKTQAEWEQNIASKNQLELADGMVSPTAKTATFQSQLKRFDRKRSAQSITFEQSTVWENWNPVKNIGTRSMGGAPVFLSLGPNNYWMFATYRNREKEKGKPATLDGFDVPLFATKNPNEFQASGGLKESKGGYHAWQSRDRSTGFIMGRLVTGNT